MVLLLLLPPPPPFVLPSLNFLLSVFLYRPCPKVERMNSDESAESTYRRRQMATKNSQEVSLWWWWWWWWWLGQLVSGGVIGMTIDDRPGPQWPQWRINRKRTKIEASLFLPSYASFWFVFIYFFFASWLGGYKKMTAAREWRTNIVDRRRLAGDEDPSLHLGRRGRRNRKCRHLSGAVLHSSWRGTKLVACRDGAILLRCGTHTAGQSAFWTSLRSIVWAFCWPERTDTDRPHSREVS